MKLELKHLAPYSPYELKCLFVGKHTVEIKGLERHPKKGDCVLWDSCIDELSKIKPILRPLSDLNKNIEVSGVGYYGKGEFSKDEWDMFLNGHKVTRILQYYCFIRLVKHHFDVFGLIDKGLAVDINTIKE